jgi:hypothetical protein
VDLVRRLTSGLGATVIAAFLAASALGPVASAESRFCRLVHLSTRKCDEERGAFSAGRFLTAYALKKLHAEITVGSTRFCRLRHTPWIYRCGVTIERGGPLPEPCMVEALVKRDHPNVFRILWKTESASCVSAHRALADLGLEG